ncbi:hypothetical protein KEJ17_00350 [Candidatus Bathyarchaeota archaeon]|nr:hypothetical protein [Candidatus Bathyarchaeota archaeon]
MSMIYGCALAPCEELTKIAGEDLEFNFVVLNLFLIVLDSEVEYSRETRRRLVELIDKINKFVQMSTEEHLKNHPSTSNS